VASFFGTQCSYCVAYCEEFGDVVGHHREHWQDQPTVYIGLRYPKDVRKRRHHHRHRLQHPSAADKDQQSVKPGNDYECQQ